MPNTQEYNYLNVNQSLAQNAEPTGTASVFAPILETFREFEQNLRPEQEIALKLGSFGHSITIFVEEIRLIGDSILVFQGNSPSGENATLMQNIHELSFVLAAIPKSPLVDKPRRIRYPELKQSPTLQDTQQ